MKNNFFVICLVILVVGILFRLMLTYNGNFLFNIDSARDFVDVREVVELGKLRLTGPNTPIDGLYDGPAWYYLLAIGYILSKGDPYSAILMQIVLWAVGGFFLLKLVKNFGSLIVAATGSIWIASNYLVLTNLYSFNPTPVTLLSPLFIYLLIKYLDQGQGRDIVFLWLLAGIFFNFEMNFGIFTPLIIIVSVILAGRIRLLKKRWFWIGAAVFILTLLPQIIFDLRHQFIMSKGLYRHVTENIGSSLNMLDHVKSVAASFYNTFLPTMMNHKLFSWVILILFASFLVSLLRQKKKDNLVLVTLSIIFIPFLGYLILPVTVNPWHLGGEMVASIVLLGYLLKKLMEKGILGKVTSTVLSVLIIWFAAANIGNFFLSDLNKVNLDPSLYKNEIAAIDYVYQYADGKNFKVYAYLPSIIDYPYQYLIWWYGLKQYRYLPIDYAYAPDRPAYISNKAAFSAREEDIRNRINSNLVFLIKEPDRHDTRSGWEGNFVKLKSVDKKVLGRLEIEIKKED